MTLLTRTTTLPISRSDSSALPRADDAPSPKVAPPADRRSRSAARTAKRGVDVLGALVGLILLFPVFLAIALLVRLDSAGSPIYRQVRVGRDGRAFSIVKFRTMHLDSDARLAELKRRHRADGPLFKLEADPRVTPVGAVLRRFSLDELPQLWNVLRGDMSLVGPRPALPCEVATYCARAARRLEAVPGMTGPWQVGGRSTLTWEDGLALDLDYVDRWSLGYDVVVLLKTVRAVLLPVGAY
ncbi:putative sugar transferase EpsL [Frondihabitans sp. 762G35]|uniref:sugar transferase n=1 Tax=Frondihabitans sp. 762G35 TaxID=1446794 RepID=UPI000D2226C1|nr:sugar transferase [Frondihabitans sp. 762G35]ARC57547.1 putative sugar transferase EpsL [Frondihabitans sp. 762G35]